jgi:hypothetical protein
MEADAMTDSIAKYLCRVCGFRQPDPPWGDDGKTPMFLICSCCGVEFGYEDAAPAGIRRYRDRWLNQPGGPAWWKAKEQPDDWDLQKQLAEIPDEFR